MDPNKKPGNWKDTYPNWDEPQYNPINNYIEPSEKNRGASIMSRLYHTVVDHLAEGRKHLLK